MARIASAMALAWFRVMRTNAASLRACGYQWPYNPLNRAVVSGSLIGVHSMIHGYRAATFRA
jgi:hypothetical protein